MFNRANLVGALCAALTLASAAPAHADGEILLTHAKALAGNVTPGDPPGYPIVLTLPGSYQLASNLFTAANKITFQVASDNVAIDLNGFTLQGSDVAWYGIVGATDAVTIRNGTITGFDFDGIHGEGENWMVEDMRVVRNGRDGVRLGQVDAAVRGSMVTQNGGNGIFCNARCLLENNAVSGNGADGIYIGSGTVLGSTILDNTNFGISGSPFVGYGNNTLAENNGGAAQVIAAVQLHPNLCSPACP